MSDRDALIEQITREVMARLGGALPGSEPPAPGSAPNPSPEVAGYEHGSPYPHAGAAPADYGKPGGAFRHPSSVDNEDTVQSRRPSQSSPDTVRKFMAAGAERIGQPPGASGVPEDIAGYIDHTLLKPDSTREQIETLCREAVQYRFASVCVNPTFVGQCARLLRGTPVKVCTVVGFPLGATTPSTKAFETRRVIREGAQEVDMVINVGALKSGDYNLVFNDIRAVVEAGHESSVLIKVIIEAALLTDEEKIAACLLAKRAKADYVKTSTGFASGGATLRDVAIMRATVGPDMGVKAAGGIGSYLDALGMIEAGATRIGASAGVRIVKESRGEARAKGKGDGY